VQFNIHNGNGRRDYPAWNTRVRILAVDAEGNARENEFDFNGEVFERSPRFIRGGHTYRLRPLRPLAVLAALAFKLKLLPALLTAEEAQSEWGQEMIVPLWPKLSRRFDNLASLLAEKDRSVKPGPINGWSFTELQIICRECGVASGSSSPSRPNLTVETSQQALDAAMAKITEMRQRASSSPNPAPTTKKKS
jgi:hypothetical protein